MSISVVLGILTNEIRTHNERSCTCVLSVSTFGKKKIVRFPVTAELIYFYYNTFFIKHKSLYIVFIYDPNYNLFMKVPFLIYLL